MKSKTTLGIKLIALTLVFALLVPFIAACGGTKISYSGSSLADGQVGVEYTASVATATGADGITYALKDGDYPAFPRRLPTLNRLPLWPQPREQARKQVFQLK